MKSRSRQVFLAALSGATVVFLMSMTVAAQQPAPAAAADRVPLAEEVFKNVTAMKGVPADQFLGTMGFISNALSLNCTSCHVGDGGGGWAEYAKDDNPRKAIARRMILMVAGINRTNFQGRQVVTCVSCHNGSIRPKTTTNLALYYGVESSDEPGDIAKGDPGGPTADQVLDKYIQAIGGAQRVAALTSVVAKGTSLGYGETQKDAVDIFAKASGQRTAIAHTPFGDTTITYDGRNGWNAMPDSLSPLPLRALSGGELDGAKLDADLMFPSRLKQSLTGWTGAVSTVIGDRDVLAIQGMSAAKLPVKLYFDEKTGLLVRSIRLAETPIGRNPTQIDYDDYRDVAGVKMPFKWTLYWQSGQAVFELTDVKANVPVDASKFARPVAPKTP